MLQKLAQAQALTGSARTEKLNEAESAFQAQFDAAKQAKLRAAYDQLDSGTKEQVDLVVTHTASLTTAERIVFAEELRKSTLTKYGLKDDLNISWIPFTRKGAERKTEGSGLERYGLRGFPAETISKLLKGEFAAKVVAQQEQPKEEVKPQEEEKAALDIYLVGFKAESKVALIKSVKDLLKLGLKESKEKVEEALKGPTLLFKTMPKDKVQEVQKKLEAAGATLEVK